MTADDEDPRPEPDAPSDASRKRRDDDTAAWDDDPTVPPQDDPKAEAPEDDSAAEPASETRAPDPPDADSTVFAPMPNAPGRAPDPEDDATHFAPMPGGHDEGTPPDDEATQFAPMPDAPAAPDDRADDDDDATRFAPMPSEADPDPSSDDEATQFAPAPGTAPPHPATHPPADRAGTATPRTTGVQAAPLRLGTAQAALSQGPGQPPSGLTDDGAPVTPAHPPTGRGNKLAVGTVINNNYRIDAVLKAGGMGEVYRGHEIGTGDPVAIKAILPDRAGDEEAGVLFKREARTLRQLVDQTIVRYYNYVHDRALDRYFLVMEFIEGVPLKDHIAQTGALPHEEVTILLTRLAGGLAKAHDQGVIHRDLSPDNVMLPGGIVREARLIDFGIAKSNVVTEGTMAGRFAGKFKYVAPEQLGAYDGRIGPATDIYGLALLICAAALGRPLNMGNSIIESVQARQGIPDLSDLPQELRPILSFMLEPDPADRPASMAAVRRLAETPSDIPLRYLGDWRPPPPATQSGTMSLPPGFATAPTAGLQTPLSGPRARDDGTAPPVAAEPERGGGGAVMGALALVFAAILGGAGWFAWSEGLIGPQAATDADGPSDTAEAAIPPPLTDTRDGFLASVDLGPCAHAARVTGGPFAGVIEYFGTRQDAPPGLADAYAERFGTAPEIVPRTVGPSQCAALDFSRALAGRGRDSQVGLSLSSDRMVSGQPIELTVTLPQDHAAWVVLVSTSGTLIDLTEGLSQPVSDTRSRTFALGLPAGAEAAPQLVLAVESDTALAQAITAPPGAQAADRLPLILEEIAARGGAASAALSYVRLVPAGP